MPQSLSRQGASTEMQHDLRRQGQKSGPFPNFYELGTFVL